MIEIGSRNINGSARHLFPKANWIGLDIEDGHGVDIVVDAVLYSPDDLVDVVVCSEVLEHAPQWEKIIAKAATWLKPNGRLIVTCAGPQRQPHSAFDGGPLRDSEHYENISQTELSDVFAQCGLIEIVASGSEVDTYCTGVMK